MAIPTIVRVLPAGQPVGTVARGPTSGGSLIEIYGSGFRVSVSQPSTNDPVNSIVREDETKTVSVTFDGVEAPYVSVVRSNYLRVRTPVSPLSSIEGSVDVVVTNLDDSGVAIPGETVTLADGYAYERVKLDKTNEPDFVRIIRQLIRNVKRHVIQNVVMTQDTDYDSDISTAEVDIATIPAVVLLGPQTPENRFYSKNDYDEEETVPEHVEIRRKPRTVDIVFDVICIGNTHIESLSLMALFHTFMDRNPYIEMDRDPSDATKGTVSYEFDFQENGGLNMTSRSSKSNVHSASGTILIRGFDIESFSGHPADAFHDFTTTLEEDLELDSVEYDG